MSDKETKKTEGKETKKTEGKAADLKDEQLDKVTGGYTSDGVDLWVKGEDKDALDGRVEKPKLSEPVSNLDLESGRVK